MATTVLMFFIFFVGATAVLTNPSADFDDTSGIFEFIYHDRQNLLLTIFNQSVCYHTDMTHTDYNINDCRGVIENRAMLQVKFNDGVSHSNLADMREKFADLLADFHCLDKVVKRLKLDDCDCEHSIYCSD